MATVEAPRAAAALTAVAILVLGAVSLLAVVLDASPPPGAHVPEGPVGTSVLGRVDLAVRGLEVLAGHPVIGVGLGGAGRSPSSAVPAGSHTPSSTS